MNTQDIFISLYDSLPFAVLITDHQPEDPKTIYANPKACGIAGYPLEEIIGRNPKMLQGPNTNRAVLDRLKEGLRRGTPYVGSTWNYRKSGEPYLLSWTITSINVFEVSYFIAIQQDLAEISPEPLQVLQLLHHKHRTTMKHLLGRILMANYLLKSETSEREEHLAIIELSAKAISDMGQLVEFITEQSLEIGGPRWVRSNKSECGAVL